MKQAHEGLEQYAGYLGRAMATVPRHESAGSFLGGRPVWAGAARAVEVTCAQCAAPMQQVAQVWAPLPAVPRRALHVFACASCRRPPGQWRVLRSHTLEPLEHEEEEKEQEEAAEPKVETAKGPLVPVDDDELDALIAARAAAPVAKAGGKKKGKGKQKNKKKKQPQAAPEPVWQGGAIVPCWMDVELVREAKKKKGMTEQQAEAIASVREQLESEAGKEQESWAGEKWEPSSKESKTFRVFRKLLQSDPARILRYRRGGEVLWISDPKPAVPRQCGTCGGPLVFEMQLLPTLLYLGEKEKLWQSVPVASIAAGVGEGEDETVIVDESAPEVIDSEEGRKKASAEAEAELLAADVLPCPLPEYGTVAVFCCRNNCGNGEMPVEECVLAQLPE
jgi:hypothetical protein